MGISTNFSMRNKSEFHFSGKPKNGLFLKKSIRYPFSPLIPHPAAAKALFFISPILLNKCMLRCAMIKKNETRKEENSKISRGIPFLHFFFCIRISSLHTNGIRKKKKNSAILKIIFPPIALFTLLQL